MEETFGGAAGIHLGTKLRGMDLVAQEMVLLLPAAIRIELGTRDFVQVDKGHSLHGGNVGSPFGLGLAHNLTLVVEGIARGQRHQDGVGTMGTDFADVATQVVAIGINGVLPLGALVEADIAGIRVYARNHGTCPFLVEELAIVVMTYGDNDPVARLQGIADGWP